MYGGEYIVYDGGGGVSPFVYFVVQKAGCSSVKQVLASLLGLDPEKASGAASGACRDPGVRRAMDLHDVFKDSHHQISKSSFLEGLHEGRYTRHFKFAFVRNPYDRLVSCYRQKLESESAQGLSRYDFGAARLYKGMPFDEFVRTVGEIPDAAADAHFRSQYLTTHGPDGAPLADFIGCFEDLARDFATVGTRIGLETSLPHLLRSGPNREHYPDLYDSGNEKLVRRRYATDLSAFGYGFGGRTS